MPRVRPSAVGLFLAGAAAAAVVMDLSATHLGHHSDSMVPVLASLYGWEPFFWMTDRNGLLLGLLARPVHHPLANLLLQFGLSVFAGVAALGLVARYLNPSATWPAVGAGAWALLLFAGGEPAPPPAAARERQSGDGEEQRHGVGLTRVEHVEPLVLAAGEQEQRPRPGADGRPGGAGVEVAGDEPERGDAGEHGQPELEEEVGEGVVNGGGEEAEEEALAVLSLIHI